MTSTPVATAKSLNRQIRGRRARLQFVEEVPFGESLRLERFCLGNGLSILLLIDRSAPVVSYQSWFRVGSRHEQPHKTGLAHLFEHLMFNETKNFHAGEFDRLLEAAGGETNAATWTDWTYYYENVPKSELELAIRLEADRLTNLVLHEPQVASEKEVVKNERRYRVEDDVEGAADEALYALAFKQHPYRWPTIGWMKDIDSFTTADCLQFYKTYYAPNNATVVIAGDLDRQECLHMVQEHYGRISAARIPKERATPESPQRRERRKRLVLPTTTEKLLLGFHAPALGDPDWVVLSLINEVLFGGRSSRLHQTLVNDLELAAECQGSITPFRDPGLYEIWISMRDGKRGREGLHALEKELVRICKKPVREDELEKARNRLELAFLHGMETASGKAEQIGFFETVLGRPEEIFARLNRYRHIGPKDVQRVATQLFRPNQRNLITVTPAGSA